MLMELRADSFDPPFLFLAHLVCLQSLMLLRPCTAGCSRMMLSYFEYAACPHPVLPSSSLRLASGRSQRGDARMRGWTAAVNRSPALSPKQSKSGSQLAAVELRKLMTEWT